MSMHPNPVPAAPPEQAPTAWVFRAGPQVVLVQGGNLPARCVKCNQPGHGGPIKKTMFWHDPMWYLLILAGLLVYVIVAICIRKKIKVHIALCQQHKRQRMVWTLMTVLGLVGGIGLFAAGIAVELPLLILVGLLLFIFGLVAAVVASSSLKPTFIDDRVARLKGAKEPFLSSLPDWPYGR